MVHEGPLSWKINKDKTIGKLLLSNFPKACFFDDCIIILLFLPQSYILYSWKTSWCCCRSRMSVLFSGVTARTSLEQLTRNTNSVPSSNSTLCWCARWRQVSIWLLICLSHSPHIYSRMNPYRVLDFPTQITDHSLWSPCPKTELRFMSWWHKQCPSRECKFSSLLSFSCFCNPLLFSL